MDDKATRNRLAELMFEVKDKVPNGTYLEFMNILGKKEKNPDFKDVQFVKLTYFHHEYLDPVRYLDEDELDVDFDFKARRINRTVRTQILELCDVCQGPIGMSLLKSRMRYKTFETIAKDIHKQNTCDIDNMCGHTNMYILCDDEWITPIKYEIIKMKT